MNLKLNRAERELRISNRFCFFVFLHESGWRLPTKIIWKKKKLPGIWEWFRTYFHVILKPCIIFTNLNKGERLFFSTIACVIFKHRCGKKDSEFTNELHHGHSSNVTETTVELSTVYINDRKKIFVTPFAIESIPFYTLFHSIPFYSILSFDARTSSFTFFTHLA